MQPWSLNHACNASWGGMRTVELEAVQEEPENMELRDECSCCRNTGPSLTSEIY